jgi:hypothetical protein
VNISRGYHSNYSRRTGITGSTLDSAYARLPATYALFPMIATQSVSRSDNFAVGRKKNTRLKHLVTHSRYREWLLSKLLRPGEAVAVLLSPLLFIAQMSLRFRDWANQRVRGLANGTG